MMVPGGSLRRNMEQVRALKDVIHNDKVQKAGHIFKVPDDMDLETATQLMAKDIVTDCIEVLEEAEVPELDGSQGTYPDAEADTELDDEPGEESTELDDDTSDDAAEGEAGDDASGDEPGEEGVDIATLSKKQIKEELKARGLSTSGNKDEMYERLKVVVDAMHPDDTDAEEAGAGEAGEE